MESSAQQTTQSSFRPVEIEMPSRMFKQSFGVMAAVALLDDTIIAMRLNKDGLRGQMKWEDNGTIVDVMYSATDLTKFDYQDELDCIQFAIKSKYITAVVKRMPKKDDEKVTIQIDSESNLVITFNGKLYRIPMQKADDKIVDLHIHPSAVVMTDMKAFVSVLDDMLLELNSQYTVMRFTMSVLANGQVHIQQISRNPTGIVYETTRGEGWSVTGTGETEVDIEKVKLLKSLIANDIILEFGFQEVDNKNPETGEPERVKKHTPLVITLDDGRVKFVTNTLKP